MRTLPSVVAHAALVGTARIEAAILKIKVTP
jgi:hypothetical protein